MTTFIPATYEHGMFKPLTPISLPEHLRVLLAVGVSEDEVPSLLLACIAESDPSFSFLDDPREDRYTPQDGEPC